MTQRSHDAKRASKASALQAAGTSLGGLVAFVLPILIVVLLAVILIPAIRGAPI